MIVDILQDVAIIALAISLVLQQRQVSRLHTQLHELQDSHLRGLVLGLGVSSKVDKLERERR